MVWGIANSSHHSLTPLMAQSNERHGYRNSTSPQQSEGNRGTQMCLKVSRQVNCLPGQAVSLPWKSGVLRYSEGSVDVPEMTVNAAC